MKIIFNQEAFPETGEIIFLAGPTPRDNSVPSWRPEALMLLRQLGFKGFVIVPENPNPDNKDANFDHGRQIAWEREGLKRSRVVLFWVPRDLKNMPAFTTNIEFGLVTERNQPFVLGFPESAEKMKYLEWVAREKGQIPYYSLKATVIAAHNKLTP